MLNAVRWLTTFLREGLEAFLVGAGTPGTGAGADLAAIDAAAGEIGTTVREGLAWAREPWPEVDQDERGMARSISS